MAWWISCCCVLLAYMSENNYVGYIDLNAPGLLQYVWTEALENLEPGWQHPTHTMEPGTANQVSVGSSDEMSVSD